MKPFTFFKISTGQRTILPYHFIGCQTKYLLVKGPFCPIISLVVRQNIYWSKDHSALSFHWLSDKMSTCQRTILPYHFIGCQTKYLLVKGPFYPVISLVVRQNVYLSKDHSTLSFHWLSDKISTCQRTILPYHFIGCQTKCLLVKGPFYPIISLVVRQNIYLSKDHSTLSFHWLSDKISTCQRTILPYHFIGCQTKYLLVKGPFYPIISLVVRQNGFYGFTVILLDSGRFLMTFSVSCK